MATIYLTLAQAIDVHRKTVEMSGGGALGHLDLGLLEGVLAHIQNDDYYQLRRKAYAPIFQRLQVPLLSGWQQAHRHHAVRPNAAFQRLPLLHQPIFA